MTDIREPRQLRKEVYRYVPLALLDCNWDTQKKKKYSYIKEFFIILENFSTRSRNNSEKNVELWKFVKIDIPLFALFWTLRTRNCGSLGVCIREI